VLKKKRPLKNQKQFQHLAAHIPVMSFSLMRPSFAQIKDGHIFSHNGGDSECADSS
jgi:hypothetical protein